MKKRSNQYGPFLVLDWAGKNQVDHVIWKLHRNGMANLVGLVKNQLADTIGLVF